MDEKRIFSEKIKGTVEDCRVCRKAADMIATGNLVYDSFVKAWAMEFECTKCHEVQHIWKAKYKHLVDEAILAAEKQGE